MRSPNENVARLSCNTCCMGHLERRIRWWHSFLGLVRGKVNIRSNYVKKGQIFKIQNFVLKHAYLVQFCLRIPKTLFIFTYVNYKCQKLHFKSDGITFTCFFLPLHSQTLRYCFEIWHVYFFVYNFTSCFPFFFWITQKIGIL